MARGWNLVGKGGKKFSSEYQPEKRGRNSKPKFVDILEEISENEGKVVFDKFELIDGGTKVVVQLPSDHALAISVLNKAKKDVRWFAEMAKIRSMYASTKTEVRRVDGDGNDVTDTPVVILGMSPEQALKKINDAKKKADDEQ